MGIGETVLTWRCMFSQYVCGLSPSAPKTRRFSGNFKLSGLMNMSGRLPMCKQ